jgi:hypothetical protein
MVPKEPFKSLAVTLGVREKNGKNKMTFAQNMT